MSAKRRRPVLGPTADTTAKLAAADQPSHNHFGSRPINVGVRLDSLSGRRSLSRLRRVGQVDAMTARRMSVGSRS